MVNQMMNPFGLINKSKRIQEKKQRIQEEEQRIYALNVEKRMQQVINYHRSIKKNNMYDPTITKKKFLTIVAAHVDSKIKYRSLLKNIELLKFQSNDIVVVNSRGLFKNDKIQAFCLMNDVQYIEIDNGPTYDFGKYVYPLQTMDTSKYDYVVFINDSIILNKPICHFYNLIIKKNVKLYGYNDSTQVNYHFQSYLFSLRKDAIPKFISIYESKKQSIKTQGDVIVTFELKLTQYFKSHDCFLKIGNEFFHRNKNIHFDNDVFYNQLLNNNLLPFTKIKKVLNIR